MKELDKSDTRTDMPDGKGRKYLSDMQQLSEHLIDTEIACPVARISQQITDLHRDLTVLCSHRDLTELCSFRRRVQSTISLDERNQTNNDNKCECRRMVHSEHNLNIED